MYMIKVLMLLTDFAAANGVSVFAISYFRTIDHDKVQMDFALYHDVQSPYTSEIERNGGKIYILPSVTNIKQHITFCKRLLREGEYQVIHDNVQVISLPIMAIAKKQHIPVRILHSHSTRMSEYKWKAVRNKLVFPILLTQSNVHFACGEKAGKAMFKKQPFVVIPNTISPSSVRFGPKTRRKIRSMMNVSDDTIILATVGRATPPKNPLFALSVIRKLHERGLDIMYWWIGGGPMDQEMRDYIQKNNMEEYVRLLGPRNDMHELYQALDLFFLPSVFEGLPLTGIEAQAYGLPCVMSDSITKELVYTDLVEFVSLDSSIEKWVDTITIQMTRIPERRSYREELESSQFSASEAGKKLTDIYVKLVEGKTISI